MMDKTQPQSRHPGQGVFKISLQQGYDGKTVRRRAHTKSRTGCQNCKRRRIKCDENRDGDEGCRKCLKSGLTCDYLNSSSSSTHKPELWPKPTAITTTSAAAVEAEDEAMTTLTRLSTRSWSRPSLSLISLEAPDNMPLQIQNGMLPSPQAMLHHFSTQTLQSCGSPLGQDIVLSSIMGMVMQTPYLLHAVLGVASAHMIYLLPAVGEVNAVQRSRHQLANAYHWTHALRLLREEISSRGARMDNMDALLATIMLLIIHQFTLSKQEDWKVPVEEEAEERKEIGQGTERERFTGSFVFIEDRAQRERLLKSWLIDQSASDRLLGQLEVYLSHSVWLPLILDSRMGVQGPKKGVGSQSQHQHPHPHPHQLEDQQQTKIMVWKPAFHVDRSDQVETLFYELCEIDDDDHAEDDADDADDADNSDNDDDGRTPSLSAQNPYMECLEQILHIRRMRPIKSHHFNKIITFLGRIKPGFFELLLQRDIAALLILAYWLYLLTGVGQWWVTERAEQECRAIIIFLQSRLATELSSSSRNKFVVTELLREPRIAMGLQGRGV